MHNFATVSVSARDAGAPSEATPPDTVEMVEQRTPVRADVVRMLSLYVYLKQSAGLRSAASRLAIHDSRLVREDELIDLDGLTYVEGLDAIYAAYIRHVVYAPPARRTFVGATGQPLNAVAPAVEPIVRGRPKLRSRSPESRARSWMLTVDAKLRRIPRESAVALLEVEFIRFELVEIRNRLQAERTTVQRLHGGGRNARNLRRHAEQRVSELRSREILLSDRLKSLVRQRIYTDGLDLLWEACTQTPEIEAECFGMKRC